MQLDRQIRVNELLLQREELFLRIHAAETEIARLLRGPCPFTRPALPSDRRSKRKPASAPLSAPAPERAAAARPEPLRRLDEGEAAFRVTYRQFNRELVETHAEHAAVATLLAAQTAQLRVLKIETLDASGAPLHTLFESTRSA